MIKASATFKSRPIEELVAFVEQYNRINAEIGKRVYDKIQAPFLSELRFEPSEPSYPIEWQSPKQRAGFFASNGFGQGIPTRRSKKIVNAWRIIGRASGAAYTIRASNRNPNAIFVVGAVNFRSRLLALKPQQRMHRNTGWPLAQDTISFWLGDVALEEYAEEFDKAVGQQLGSFSISKRNR